MDYFQAQRLASKKGVTEETIEKDFFIELFLSYLPKSKFLKEKLIFRGGTALKKAYFPEYRFSEDLDFLVEEDENLNEYEDKFTHFLSIINSEYPFQLTKRSESTKDRVQLFTSYNIIPEIKISKELKIDILKDDIIPSFEGKRILFAYQEFNKENVILNTYTLESIVSDKISRILNTANEPRDIFDLWYLLKLDIDTEKIKGELKKRFAHSIYFPNILKEILKEDYKRNWQVRLEKQIGNLPPYRKVMDELERLIKEKLIRA